MPSRGRLAMGSSPLTRGKLRATPADGPAPGLIPAHAGKTSSTRRRAWAARAHPRSRGENKGTWAIAHVCQGSSPLTRGKRRVAGGVWARWGLIPAHAGKTPRGRWGVGSLGAHPRSRGENRFRHSHGDRDSGSSPLTRGKPGRNLPWQTIPVAHPRSRGENREQLRVEDLRLGSSPLTRGKRGVLLRALSGPGLIPAHAGKTQRRARIVRAPRAHPRSRGEN